MDTIDDFVRVRRMQDVWFLLERKFPTLKQKGESLYHARRDGRIRLLITLHPKYQPLNKPFGPENDAEWNLLHACVVEAMNTTVHQLREEFL